MKEQKCGRKANEEMWSRQKNKARRKTGQDYVRYIENRKGEISHNKESNAREIGLPCNSANIQ